MNLEIKDVGFNAIDVYATIPISFQVRSRLRLPDLEEFPVGPYLKDYDAHENERPTALPQRFDTTNWGVLLACVDDVPVGGCIIAWNSPGFDMLRGRTDLAVLADIRVAPEARGKGVGTQLFKAAVDWATQRRCIELHVETQDTNVSACRFYQAMGCTIESIQLGAYGEDCDEAKIIWTLPLPNN
jgi:GNAT superfamily N-acetyltransferase